MPIPDAPPGTSRARRQQARQEKHLTPLIGENRNLRGPARIFLHEGRLFIRTPDDEEAEPLAEAVDRLFVRKGEGQLRFQRDETDTLVRAEPALPATKIK